MSDGLTLTRRGFLAAGSAAMLAAYTRPRQLFAALPVQERLVAAGDFSADWRMQAADVVKAAGEMLSTTKVDASGWYRVRTPCTVLAGLVANGEYPDLFTGDNITKVPKERFKGAWWYRKEFSLGDVANQQVWLYFKGINYRANIWLNGKRVEESKDIVGTYRDFAINVTDDVNAAGTNVLAVEVFPPGKSDLAITFVDWAPAPPDENMGLWQEVELRTTGPVTIRYPHVVTNLNEGRDVAELSILADVVNATHQALSGTLTARIGGGATADDVRVSQAITLAPGEEKTVTMDAAAHAELRVKNPRLWWPWQLGKPEMYSLRLEFAATGRTSDACDLSFGVRTVTSRLDNGHALFSINGTDVLILGGGYAPDLLQRRSLPGRPNLQEDHIRYTRDMHLNTIRLEGKLEDDAFYDLCDRYGIFVMAGWCCCSPWEKWKSWKEEQHVVAMESLRYQIRRARSHPSMLVWLNGSDNAPPPTVEGEYLAIEKELRWPCPTLSSAANKKAASGPSGVKMEGPYKWEPPMYWLTDKTKGGAWGFNTEVGPGAAPPPLESLEKMLTPEHRWPIDEMWDLHCGKGSFGQINDFTGPLDARYGKSRNLADFAWKSQAQAYETIRAMFEGFRRNKFTATGEIQWMLNNAWPSLIWHLYDYYLRPGGAYFATKIACEPVHILYSYDNASIVVANETLGAVRGLMARAAIYDIKSRLRHEQTQGCDSEANAAVRVFTLEVPEDISKTYFVRLSLEDSSGQVISVNSYWLSTKPDVLSTKEDDKDDWNITRCSSYADYTALETLLTVKLELSEPEFAAAGGEQEVRVRVKNASATIAMLVRVRLMKGDGEEVLPIRWEDNYMMLLAGEERALRGRYLAAYGGGKLKVIGDCFNNRLG